VNRQASVTSASPCRDTEGAIRISEPKKLSHLQIEQDRRVTGFHLRRTRLAGLHSFDELSLR